MIAAWPLKLGYSHSLRCRVRRDQALFLHEWLQVKGEEVERPCTGGDDRGFSLGCSQQGVVEGDVAALTAGLEPAVTIHKIDKQVLTRLG